MKIATCKLESVTPYSQSRSLEFSKHLMREGEKIADFDLRCWREKMHYDQDGQVFIPASAFTFAIHRAAAKLGLKMKGAATWKGPFQSGVIVLDNVPLGIHKDDVPSHDLYMNLDGQRGSAKRGIRRYPVFHQWKATVEYHVVDDRITESVFQAHLEAAGKLVGIGQYRPDNGGYFGRFRVTNVAWDDHAVV